MLFNLQNHKTRHRLHTQSAKSASHWARVNKMHTIMLTKLQLMWMAANQDPNSQLDSLIGQSFLIPPRYNLMSVYYADFQSTNFDNFFLWQIFECFIFEISFNHMKVIRERFCPIVYLSTTHVAGADHCWDFVGGYHFTIFWRDFGCSVRDVEIA